MDEFLHYLIKGICDKEDIIAISKNDSEYAIEYTIEVAEDQYGRVIGKNGKTINSLKTLLNLYAYKKGDESKKRIILKVKDSSSPHIAIAQTDSPSLDN